MTDRQRIDWDHLSPLPRRKVAGATRDDLAARKFNMGKAKHCGRNHVQNWKRRQVSAQATEQAKLTQKMNFERARKHIDAARAYWRGEADTHP